MVQSGAIRSRQKAGVQSFPSIKEESKSAKKSPHTFLARCLRVATRSGRGSVEICGASSINRRIKSTLRLPPGDGFNGRISGA